ncbi:MAG: flagellar hook capping FlgD N-terminal domain-containing protein [Balneolaceae bacterium]
MDINSINSLTSLANNQRTSQNENELGQQEFLQLLVAQMRNQDPINPMEGAEFASQLAQFNSVEQLINVNSGLEQLQGSQEMMSSSLTNSMAASLTGKHVKALSNDVHLASGEGANVQFKLNNTAAEVEFVVRNESGNEVRRETVNGLSSGDNTWVWDGRSNSGDRMADGNYTVEVMASNDGEEVDSMVYTEGFVDKVRYSGDGVFLSVNGIQVSIGDVEEVGNGPF